MEDTSSRLGDAIRARRQQLGLSLNDVALASGLHKSLLSRIETGAVAMPNTSTLARLATALGLTLTDLYGLVTDQARHALPPLKPYLRAKYDLPDAAIADIEAYLARYGGLGTGPMTGEDERPEENN